MFTVNYELRLRIAYTKKKFICNLELLDPFFLLLIEEKEKRSATLDIYIFLNHEKKISIILYQSFVHFDLILIWHVCNIMVGGT